MLVSNFATRLNEAMKIRKLKAAEITRISEEMSEKGIINKPLTKPLISHYLKGTYKAKQDNIYALSLILNVDEAWLIGYDVPINQNAISIDNHIFKGLTQEQIEIVKNYIEFIKNQKRREEN